MVLLSVEFLQKAKASKNPLNTDEMAQQFAMKHIEQPVQLHQRVNVSKLCKNLNVMSRPLEFWWANIFNKFTLHFDVIQF
jgi:hypothetical protein